MSNIYQICYIYKLFPDKQETSKLLPFINMLRLNIFLGNKNFF